MFTPRVNLKKSGGDEAEKPFWISYADLMTSLMVLFLVVMLASLLALTQTVTAMVKSQHEFAKFKQTERDYNRAKKVVDQRIADAAKKSGLHFRAGNVSFAGRELFADGSNELDSRAAFRLRKFANRMIVISATKGGRRIVSSVSIVGFASKKGDFLGNLQLSAERSQRAMCELLRGSGKPTRNERDFRRLFETGGASATRLKKTESGSRRIELQIQYVGANGKNKQRRSEVDNANDNGECPL